MPVRIAVGLRSSKAHVACGWGLSSSCTLPCAKHARWSPWRAVRWGAQSCRRHCKL